MKTNANARPRAAALLLAAAALPLTPAVAQTAPPGAPPVTATVPAATQPEAAPAPVAASPTAAPAPVFAAPSPVVQATPARPAPAATEAETTAETSAPAARPSAARPARAVIAPRQAASAPAAPIAAAVPAPVTAPAAPVAAQTPFAQPTTATDDPPAPASEPTVASERPVWPWVVAGLALLGLIIAALSYGRRRRAFARYDNYDPREVDTSRAAQPTMAAQPIVPAAVESRAEPEVVETPHGADAVIAETPAPVQHAPVTPFMLRDDERPWIGLTLLPLCVGAQGEDMIVQYELTVENAGTVPAEGVRVSSFLIDERDESGRMTAIGDVQSHVIDVAPEGSVPLTTTITIDRSLIREGAFLPKVVADARYPLPGDREGHFAARFAMGIADGDDLSGVDVANGDAMHDDVGARLDDVLERA